MNFLKKYWLWITIAIVIIVIVYIVYVQKKKADEEAKKKDPATPIVEQKASAATPTASGAKNLFSPKTFQEAQLMMYGDDIKNGKYTLTTEQENEAKAYQSFGAIGGKLPNLYRFYAIALYDNGNPLKFKLKDYYTASDVDFNTVRSYFNLSKPFVTESFMY